MSLNTNDALVYDSNQVRVSFAGYSISKGAGASGYADGPFLEVEQAGPDFDYKKGTDGTVTRYAKNETVTKVKVRTMQSSSTNAFLSTMLQLDRTTPGGQGIGSFVYEDLQGTTLFTSLAAWVEGPPNVVFDGEPTEREWTIVCTKVTRIDGGN